MAQVAGCWSTASLNATLKLEELLLCLECHRVMEEPHTVGSCDHHFCGVCINRAMAVAMKCPVCGVPVWVKDLKTNKQVDNLIKLVSTMKSLLSIGSKSSILSAQKHQEHVPSVNNTDKIAPAARIFKNPRLRKKLRSRQFSHRVKCPPSTIEELTHCTAMFSNASLLSPPPPPRSTRSSRNVRTASIRDIKGLNKGKPTCKWPTKLKSPTKKIDQSSLKTRSYVYSKLDTIPEKTEDLEVFSTVQHAPMSRNMKGETPLHIAAIKGDINAVNCLLKNGVDPNVKDNAGWTSLHEACNHGHAAIASILIKYGALVNVHGLDNDTPLHDAMANNHKDVVKLLLLEGANPSLKNTHGLTAEDIAPPSKKMKTVLAEHLPVSCCRSSNAVTVCPLISPEIVHGDSCIVILCTGLEVYQKNQVEELASLLGCAAVVGSLSMNVSHVVTNCNQAMCCSRTFKFLCGVATGKWIVSFQWVVDSLAAQSWMKEVSYEIEGVIVGESNLVSYAPRKGRDRKVKGLPGLFDGCEFFLSGRFEPPQASREDFSKLIELAGGQLLTEDPRSLSYAGHPSRMKQSKKLSTFVLYDPHLRQNTRMSSRDALGITLVPASWLLDCLSCYEIVSY